MRRFSKIPPSSLRSGAARAAIGLQQPKKSAAKGLSSKLFTLWITLACVALVLLLGSIPLPAPQMYLEADADAFTVEADDELELAGMAGSATIEIVGDVTARQLALEAKSLSSVVLEKGARVEFERTKECLQIAPIRRPSLRGNSPALSLMLLHNDQGSTTSRRTRLSPGAVMRLCGIDGNTRLQGKVSRIDLSRVQTRDLERGFELRTSAIVKGRISWPDVDQTNNLGEFDPISIREIDAGLLVLSASAPLHVVFAGNARHVRNGGVGLQARPADMRPTVLAWLTHSRVAALFGLVTGLLGMSWTALRYFGLAPSA